jgi:Flp pilus assembly protein protease CpaA
MEYTFLTIYYLIGIIIATAQDIKRREIDNWLNLYLITGGLIYLSIQAINNNDYTYTTIIGFLLITMYALAHLFYHGKIFAGGDAKLLFALTPLFYNQNIIISYQQLLTFILSLMIAGSLYGIGYASTLYYQHRKNINKKLQKQKNLHYLSITSITILGILTLYQQALLPLLLTIPLLPYLYTIAKELEKEALTKTITGKELREGDWITKDITIKGKTIKANWEGIEKEDLQLLQHKKKITIKEGIPFAPAFLIAYLLYNIIGTNIFNIL